MPKVRFTILLYANQTDAFYYREAVESVANQDRDDYELIILDDNDSTILDRIAGEFYPNGDKRLKYKRLKKHIGRAYAYNIGLHFASGDYIVTLGQHDRISSNTLSLLASEIDRTETPIDIIYVDQDELVGDYRRNPHFKCGFNKELLLQDNYIGEFLCISNRTFRKMGTFREDILLADLYEFLLRGLDHELEIRHLSSLLYHRRMISVADANIYRRVLRESYEAHVRVLRGYLKRVGIVAEIKTDAQYRYWKVNYFGDDYGSHRRDYILLREKGVRVKTKKAQEILYGYLKQPDIGVVGVRFREGFTKIDNCGFIFDKHGEIYPACNGKSLYTDGYENRIVLSQDVSMVDFGYCMLDATLYQKLRGLDTSLKGRDAVLDYCLRVQRAGYRVVYVPEVIAYRKHKETVSTRLSNARLLEKWGKKLAEGDPFYNENLPMGLDNYQLW